MKTLSEILASEKVREAIFQLRQRFTGGGAGQYGALVTPKQRAWIMEWLMSSPVVPDELRTIVIERLDEPAPCTFDDLKAAFYQFVLVPDENLEAGYYSLCSGLLQAAGRRRRSQPFSFASGPFSIYPRTDFEEKLGWIPHVYIVLWNSQDNAFRLVMCGTLPSTDSSFGVASKGTIFAFAEAQATESAFKRFCADCELVLSSFFSGMEQLNYLRNEFSREGIRDEAAAPEEDFLYSHWCISQDGSGLTTRFGLLYSWLEFFFLRDPQKKTYARRLQTAIRLIGEAHRQTNAAIAIALYVSAIESILCRKGADTTKMFSENISALLEPDPFNRRSATRLATRVYGLRSDVFHGNEIASTHEDLFIARILALCPSIVADPFG